MTRINVTSISDMQSTRDRDSSHNPRLRHSRWFFITDSPCKDSCELARTGDGGGADCKIAVGRSSGLMKRRAACIAAAWVSMRRGGPTWGDANRAFYGAPGCLVVALVAPCAYRGLRQVPRDPPRLSVALFSRHPLRPPDY